MKYIKLYIKTICLLIMQFNSIKLNSVTDIFFVVDWQNINAVWWWALYHCCRYTYDMNSVMGNRNPFLNPRGASARASDSNHNKIRRVALSYVKIKNTKTYREPPPGYVAKLATTIHYYVYYRLICVTRVMVYILLAI